MIKLYNRELKYIILENYIYELFRNNKYNLNDILQQSNKPSIKKMLILCKCYVNVMLMSKSSLPY